MMFSFDREAYGTPQSMDHFRTVFAGKPSFEVLSERGEEYDYNPIRRSHVSYGFGMEGAHTPTRPRIPYISMHVIEQALAERKQHERDYTPKRIFQALLRSVYESASTDFRPNVVVLGPVPSHVAEVSMVGLVAKPIDETTFYTDIRGIGRTSAALLHETHQRLLGDVR